MARFAQIKLFACIYKILLWCKLNCWSTRINEQLKSKNLITANKMPFADGALCAAVPWVCKLKFYHDKITQIIYTSGTLNKFHFNAFLSWLLFEVFRPRHSNPTKYVSYLEGFAGFAFKWVKKLFFSFLFFFISNGEHTHTWCN